MRSSTSPADSSSSEPTTASEARLPLMQRVMVMGGLALMAGAVFIDGWHINQSINEPRWEGYEPAPLVMEGGDPYIRALMRTISYSEANDPQPYSLLYGGEHVEDLSQHPDLCVPIVAGPNVGDCTTAAGRYQFITTTWESQAHRYHPDPDGFWIWQEYSFAPEYQDEVVYGWLSDPTDWGTDLSQLLRDGQLNEVLYILSPTWTSLGHGIETNDLSNDLPWVYEQVLQEELETVSP
ncbi:MULTISPECIES: glycoside hydrolase family protein [unclassified Leptolyngbya]|uniref:glycoside hydrolase family 24 protein n=1 Tax=unclassified Leptolyngbya TaxID=2650499 RepID=UPI00321F687A